ncbi:hypothetical protein BMS3Bbin12_01045 [bacterium BMS3Bbin12]|nr:hypothetical protein BMS3Bbin12_01045 [bacterium BMS3Bbin12]GBE50174.1 hypothetical protein BMS3Bbin13_01103 [bacterium BMS3Bbin13]
MGVVWGFQVIGADTGRRSRGPGPGGWSPLYPYRAMVRAARARTHRFGAARRQIRR